jgi:hypothetical protein
MKTQRQRRSERDVLAYIRRFGLLHDLPGATLAWCAALRRLQDAGRIRRDAQGHGWVLSRTVAR